MHTHLCLWVCVLNVTVFPSLVQCCSLLISLGTALSKHMHNKQGLVISGYGLEFPKRGKVFPYAAWQRLGAPLSLLLSSFLARSIFICVAHLSNGNFYRRVEWRTSVCVVLCLGFLKSRLIALPQCILCVHPCDSSNLSLSI